MATDQRKSDYGISLEVCRSLNYTAFRLIKEEGAIRHDCPKIVKVAKIHLRAMSPILHTHPTWSVLGSEQAKPLAVLATVVCSENTLITRLTR